MKLTLEEKRRIIVEEHLRDGTPISYLARKYRVSRDTLIFLKRRYLLHGESVFEKGKRFYSNEFKLSCVERIVKHGELLSEVALKEDIDIGTVHNWLTQYKQNNGKLEPMSKKKKKATGAEINSVNDKTVQEELLRLRAENAYLKKLISLVQEEDELLKRK